MKPRILFVDDEPYILHGLRRMLRPMQEEWDLEFAEDAEAGWKILAQKPCDVVVSDMRMPGQDGAQFLEMVARTYPQTVRIILSGHSDPETVLRAVGPTHQYLAKPCNRDKVRETLISALALRDLLRNPELVRLVSQLKSLPTLPNLYLELVRELQSPEVTMTKVGQIIGRDVGMTAKVLQLVNSAFFGLTTTVTDPVHAARLLGPEILKALVLNVQIFSQFRRLQLGPLSVARISDHCMAVGQFARRLLHHERMSEKLVERAMAAGILHDIGKLILAQNLADRYGEIIKRAVRDQVRLWEAEREALGATHAEIGAYLLGLWGLPKSVVQAVAYHHRPGQARETSISTVIVHAANALVHRVRPQPGGLPRDEIDRTCLEVHGFADKLPFWENLLKETDEQS